MARVSCRLVALVLAAASCSKPGVKKPAPDSLEAYCGSAPCRRHDDAVSNLRERTTAGSSCTLGDLGTCGELRFVRFSDGYWGFTEWFDAKGTMVAAEGWSDISPRTQHGSVPACTLTPVERLCATRSDH